MRNRRPLGSPVLVALVAPLLVAVLAADQWDEVARRLTPDASPLVRSLTAILCQHLVERRVVSAAELGAVPAPDAFRALLQARAGKDVIELGEDLMRSFAAGNPATPATSSEWASRTSEHYVFLARRGSAAERVLDDIAQESETCRRMIVAAFGLEERLAGAERMLSARLPKEVTGIDGAPRMVVYLHGRREEAAKGELGAHGVGAAHFGATLSDEGRVRLTGTIHIVYFNAYSLFILQHEIAHLTVLLASFDPSAATGVFKGEADLRAAFTRGYRLQPAFVMEGLADHGLLYRGLYARWGLLGTPESLTLALRDSRKLPPLPALLTASSRTYRSNDRAYSLAIATFLEYLRETKGAEAVRSWLFDPAGLERAFPTHLGTTIPEAERTWIAWLGDRGRTPGERTGR